MDKITVKDLEVFANHGVYEQENFLGQKFVISAVLHTDTRMAGLTDNLENSINYGEVSHLIKKIVEGNTWNLIEKIAEEVAHTILVTYSTLVKQVDITVKNHGHQSIFHLIPFQSKSAEAGILPILLLALIWVIKKHILTVRLPCLMQQRTAVLFRFLIIL